MTTAIAAAVLFAQLTLGLFATCDTTLIDGATYDRVEQKWCLRPGGAYIFSCDPLKTGHCAMIDMEEMRVVEEWWRI